MTFYVNDEVVAEYYNTEDNYVLSASGELSYIATAQNRWQTFTVIATDEVGNVSAETSVRFLLTDNLFVQWFNNTPLFAGSIAGILLLGGATFFIIFKRRKNGGEEQAQG
ncbi:MAG: LPXTG cell wall anchor domain-containing protein [Lachnospiraceae bacterium]|nr:LPXTG cell wall anchor domain-containing protein [Lachnospiraceae bacterium]